MKRKAIMGLSLLVAFIMSCTTPKSVVELAVPTPIPTPPVDLPIWQEGVYIKDDSEVAQTDAFEIHLITIYEDLPFYDGTVPFEFEAWELPLNPPYNPLKMLYIFDNFITFFSYDDPTSGIASRARTYDKANGLLAEAQLEEILGDGTVVILEVHYNKDGEIIFWCRSRIAPILGFKEEEFDSHGVKEQDYYFVWPAY
ncbi:hypothetical protein GYA37_02210 [candidate division WWE3 bacterium]|uniref:Lipoprotein n=1 Tax=candidate division WWE3 bacterium TaxID=2053526 RepID=A0A7X9HTQ0_UNCKA|nr:hypothetical protein [candidate division WWE3 bacterium]